MGRDASKHSAVAPTKLSIEELARKKADEVEPRTGKTYGQILIDTMWVRALKGDKAMAKLLSEPLIEMRKDGRRAEKIKQYEAEILMDLNLSEPRSFAQRSMILRMATACVNIDEAYEQRGIAKREVDLQHWRKMETVYSKEIDRHIKNLGIDKMKPAKKKVGDYFAIKYGKKPKAS